MADAMDCELNRLREILSSVGQDSANDYLDSLGWQKTRALLHVDLASTCATCDNYQTAQKINVFGEVNWRISDVVVVTETIGCVHVLREMADTLAQIVNTLILSSCFDEYEVKIFNVLDELEKRNSSSPIRNAVRKLRKSDEFKYISAFCNTIKHRYQVGSGHAVEINLGKTTIKLSRLGQPAEIVSEEGSSKDGVRFQDFDYKKEKFPELWAEDIYQRYTDKMFKLVASVLNEIGSDVSSA